MKTKLIITFVILLSGLMATAQDISKDNPPVMIESQSKYGVTATIDTLSKIAVKSGWSDGRTYVSRMNAPAFAGMIGGDAAKTILEAFTVAEEFIKAVTN